MRSLIWSPLVLTLAACGSMSAKIERSDDYEQVVGTSYRVAVLPFDVSAEIEGSLLEGLGSLGSLLTLSGLDDSAPPQDIAAAVMRRAVVASLSGSRIQVADLRTTDVEASHADLHAIDADDQEAVRRFAQTMRVDGVVFAEIHSWNREYYVLESVQEVGMKARLVDGRTGETLIETDRTNSEDAGLSGGPTGFFSLGTAPISGLSGEVLERLSAEVARAVASDLAGRELVDVEFDPSNASGDAPRMSFVAVTSDRQGPLQPGDRVHVVAIGSGEGNVTFDLGRYRRQIPMRRVGEARGIAGHRATFVGQYEVQEGESAGPLPVFVTIRKQVGERTLRSTRRVVGSTVTLGG